MTSAETTTPVEAPAGEAEAHDGHDHHPSDLRYVGIALILAVLTGIEIALYYIDTGPAEVPALLTLMVLKFAIVALYFMHLKFDSAWANRMFLIGIFMAVTVYVATLATFTYWTAY